MMGNLFKVYRTTFDPSLEGLSENGVERLDLIEGHMHGCHEGSTDVVHLLDHVRGFGSLLQEERHVRERIGDTLEKRHRVEDVDRHGNIHDRFA